jgi:hypothetical protein
MLKRLLAEHRDFWNIRNRRSLYVAILIFLLAVYIQTGTGRYAARSATNFVGDIILDNIPVFQIDFLIVGAAVLFGFLVALLFILKPRYALFGLKVVALLMVTRSFFISLTHLGIYPGQIPLDGNEFLYGFYKFFSFEADFFFSGHTAFPFLIGLIFWEEKFWRYFFFGTSFLFASSVLLAHAHYSIDVFAAPFITYSVFIVASKLFADDYVLLRPR